MKDQIAMSKTNGACCIAIPLFRWHHDEESLGELKDYSLFFATNIKPVAYVLDVGEIGQLVNAEFAEKHLEFLGDL